ncbi:alcohol dehydrogenase catalytic domain-containing protein [Streptomyces sp. NPDC088253]|uniref:alcohol dehydrogenase catalytic domain-containing protein n=1 Tax=Streptomyces sp. NPDC088253 TaxID=3365846 RepID=UPI00381A9F7E
MRQRPARPQLPQVYRGGFAMGHEPSGRIGHVGDSVTGWHVGQRVAVIPNGNVCGVCTYCVTGRPDFCHQATMETALGLRRRDGALARRTAAFPGTPRAVPEAMGRVEAAWVEPTATALRAGEPAGDLTGRTVAVYGGGPIGQLAVPSSTVRSACRPAATSRSTLSRRRSGRWRRHGRRSRRFARPRS